MCISHGKQSIFYTIGLLLLTISSFGRTPVIRAYCRSIRPTRLVDWINPDVFDTLQWSSNRPLYLSTQIWDHRVVITAKEIRIYN